MDTESAKLKWIVWIFFVMMPLVAQFNMLEADTYQQSRERAFNWQHPTFARSAVAAHINGVVPEAFDMSPASEVDFQRLLPYVRLSQIEKNHLASIYSQDISFHYQAVFDPDAVDPRRDTQLDRHFHLAVNRAFSTAAGATAEDRPAAPPKTVEIAQTKKLRHSLVAAEHIELQFRRSFWPEFTLLQFKEPSVLEKGWQIGYENERSVQYDRIISEVASRHNIEPELIKAIITVESYFDHKAESHRGAKGLMQLMPETAQELGVTDIHDPVQNIEAGARYYKWLLEKLKGDRDLALAAYNAGIKHVMNYGGIPPFAETRDYVLKVQQYYERYKVSPNRS